MLTKIRLKNFKAFKDTGDIEIAPLTVLTGPNSSGKSAIIRAMMALRQTTESRDPNTAFVPSGSYVDLGPYEDFVFMQEVKSSVGFYVEWRLSSTPVVFGRYMTSAQDQLEMSALVELAYLSSTDRIYLAESTVSFINREIEVHKTTKRGNQIGRSYRTRVNWQNELSANLADSSVAKFYAAPPFQMNDLRVKSGEGRVGQELLASQIANSIEDSITREFAQFHYIGPLRASPQRMYLSAGETPREVGTAGELGPAILWSASEDTQLNLEKRLSNWCSRMGLAFEIDLFAVYGGFFQVVVVDAFNKQPINLPDAGFGTSQILPILIQGLIAPLGSTLMLEQPEIHLHPKVQADLADFLIEVSQRGVGVVVETHSEHLITRLQRRIAEETLDPEQVAVYYVTPSPEGSGLERVHLNEYGQFPAAPKGFFEEGFEEGFDFIRAVGERKRKERLARGGD